MVTVLTNHIYNFKMVTTMPTKNVIPIINKKNIGTAVDKRVRDCYHGLERLNQEYIKSELKL